LTDRREMLHDDTYWLSEAARQVKFPTFKNPRWRITAMFKNRKMAIPSHRLNRSTRNLAQ